jgi:hypothetical protein
VLATPTALDKSQPKHAHAASLSMSHKTNETTNTILTASPRPANPILTARRNQSVGRDGTIAPNTQLYVANLTNILRQRHSPTASAIDLYKWSWHYSALMLGRGRVKKSTRQKPTERLK